MNSTAVLLPPKLPHNRYSPSPFLLFWQPSKAALSAQLRCLPLLFGAFNKVHQDDFLWIIELLLYSTCGECVSGKIFLCLPSVFVIEERTRMRQGKDDILQTYNEHRSVQQREKNLCHFTSFLSLLQRGSTHEWCWWASVHPSASQAGISYIKIWPLKQWPNTIKLKTG